MFKPIPAGSRWWLALMAAALASLAVLAWLQFRWIGRVSQAEGEHMTAHLNTALLRLSRDFDLTVSRAVMGMGYRPGRWAARDGGTMAERYSRWLELTPERRLIHAVYLAEAGSGDLLALNAAEERFDRVAWPPELLAWRDRLAATPLPMPGPGRGAARLVDESIPAVFVPRFGRQGRGGGPPRQGPPEPAGWTIVELNLQYIQRRLLPELVRIYLPGTGELDCDVLITERSDPARVIYASNPALPAGYFSSPDGAIGLLDLRPAGPPPWMPPARASAPPAAPMRAGWRLVVKNRSGSLDALVAQTRRRNLAVSFGMLLLMCGALAVLLLSTRRAQRLAQSQMEFVAGVSHELRTPLAVICSAADNLADGVVSSTAQARRYGSVIGGEGRRLARMVEQILGFAGIQRGSAKYELEPADLRDVISAALAACDAEIRRSGCGVRTDIDPDLPLVMADSVSLVHALRNLVDNAIRHGGGSVEVSARTGAGGTVEVRVEDGGPGVDAADRPHIFEPFYRGRKPVADQKHGFGLGLALVKHIAEAHGGSVRLESAPGRGAGFVLTLPAGPAARLEEADAGAENSAG